MLCNHRVKSGFGVDVRAKFGELVWITATLAFLMWLARRSRSKKSTCKDGGPLSFWVSETSEKSIWKWRADFVILSVSEKSTKIKRKLAIFGYFASLSMTKFMTQRVFGMTRQVSMTFLWIWQENRHCEPFFWKTAWQSINLALLFRGLPRKSKILLPKAKP